MIVLKIPETIIGSAQFGTQNLALQAYKVADLQGREDMMGTQNGRRPMYSIGRRPFIFLVLVPQSRSGF